MPHNVGDQIWIDGKCYVVTSVDPKLTPFKKRNQHTKIEGYTLGLRLALPTDYPPCLKE